MLESPYTQLEDGRRDGGSCWWSVAVERQKVCREWRSDCAIVSSEYDE